MQQGQGTIPGLLQAEGLGVVPHGQQEVLLLDVKFQQAAAGGSTGAKNHISKSPLPVRGPEQ